MTHSMSWPVKFIALPEPFTAKHPKRRDITRHALHAHDRYTQVFRGVWIDEAELSETAVPTWADREWFGAFVRLRGIRLLYPELVGSHATAATLYGLPIPVRLRDRWVCVATEVMNLRIERHGVRLYRTKSLDTSLIELLDLPLVTVPLLVSQLAASLTLVELVQLGDAAIGKQAGGPYITLDALRERVLERSKYRGRSLAKKALTLMRPTVESPRETWLRLWLIDNGFSEPVVHPPVVSEIGNCVLHPDLGYPELKIAIEYEGDQHRTSPARFAADIRRRELLEAEGWIVLRVAKSTNMVSFGRTLASRIRQRGGRSGLAARPSR